MTAKLLPASIDDETDASATIRGIPKVNSARPGVRRAPMKSPAASSSRSRVGELESIRQLRAAQCAALTQDVESLIRRKGIEYVSFDIFDTILSRGQESERGRFFETAKIQQQYIAGKHADISADDLYFARMTAAQMAYRFTPHKEGSREASITEIYDFLVAVLGLPRTLRDRLIDIELDYEVSVLSPNQPLIDLIARLAATGVKVELITDMYLEAKHIRRVFRGLQMPEWMHDMPLWSSAEMKFTKSNGTLFTHVSATHGLPFAKMLHIGDNANAEIRIAYQLGMNALHLPLDEVCHNKRRQDEAEMIAQKGI